MKCSELRNLKTPIVVRVFRSKWGIARVLKDGCQCTVGFSRSWLVNKLADGAFSLILHCKKETGEKCFVISARWLCGNDRTLPSR